MKQIKYKSGYKYILNEDYVTLIRISPVENITTDFIDLALNRVLTIKKGYAWDGPSGPTLDTKNFMRGSLVHDALYQLMREGYIYGGMRKQADQELVRICREDGMGILRSSLVSLGLRFFGEAFVKSKAIRKPKLAP